jgi:hypothetical protein
MSVFTDRMIAAGVVASIADQMEADLTSDLVKAKAARTRLTTSIDQKQTEIDGLRAERTIQIGIIADIRTTLGDPNA